MTDTTDVTPHSLHLDTRVLLTAEEAAVALTLSERTLRERSLAGEIPSFKVGDRRLYSVDALRAWALSKCQTHGMDLAEGSG